MSQVTSLYLKETQVQGPNWESCQVSGLMWTKKSSGTKLKKLPSSGTKC